MGTSPKIVDGFQKSEEIFDGWRCFNVIIGGVSRKDIISLFGPFNPGDVLLRLEESNWGSLLKTLEIFPSATQARKNGWDKDIAVGWSEARFKKQRIAVFVLKQPPSRWQRFKKWLSRRRINTPSVPKSGS